MAGNPYDPFQDDDTFDPFDESNQAVPAMPLEDLLRRAPRTPQPAADPATGPEFDPSFDVADASAYAPPTRPISEQAFTRQSPTRQSPTRQDSTQPFVNPYANDPTVSKNIPIDPSAAYYGAPTYVPDASTAYDPLRAPRDTGEDIPPALDNPKSEVRPQQGISSKDIHANFRDLITLNPSVFGDIQQGVDPNNPVARSQFNQANFWARIQAEQGGIEAFNRAPSVVKTAFINKFTDERMREIIPGYGRGQKLPAQVNQIRKSIYDDMRAATVLELEGIPKARQNTLLGATADETIVNVLKSPDLDRRLLEDMDVEDRPKYINAFLRRAAGKNQDLLRELRFQLSPLLIDKDGANYDTYVKDAFPTKEEETKDKDQSGFVSSVGGFLRGAKDWAAYSVGEVAKTPGYMASLMATIPRAVTGKEAKDIPGNQSYEDFARWWTTGVSGNVSKVSSEQALTRRAAQDKAKKKAVSESTGVLDAIGGYIGTMANDPQTSFEELSGMLASALASGGAGAATAKAVAKGAAKETVKKAATVGAVGASAALTAGQTQQDAYAQLVPPENTPAYELARARYKTSELSKARQAAATDYDLDADFKNWARSSADAAGLTAGLVVLGFGGFGGSIERKLAGEVSKGKLTSEVVKTALVEGGSEGLEEYASAVAQGYYDRVREDYGKDTDKLYDAAMDGQARIQAGIGFILGGAVGSGFAMLHGVHNAKSRDDLPPLPDEPPLTPGTQDGAQGSDTQATDAQATDTQGSDTQGSVQGVDAAPNDVSLPEAIPLPLPAALTNPDLSVQGLESEITALHDERTVLEGQNKKMPKDPSIVQLRQRAANNTRIEAIATTLSAKLTELDAVTRDVGRASKVMVREENGAPTGVKMDRSEFNTLQDGQRAAQEDSRFKADLASKYNDAQNAPSARLVTLKEAKKALPVTVATRLNELRQAQVDIKSSRVNQLTEKVAQEKTTLENIDKTRNANTESSLSAKLAKDKKATQSRLRNATAKLEQAQAELDVLNSERDYTSKTVVFTQEYKDALAENEQDAANTQAELDSAVKQTKELTNEATAALEDFRQREGFSAEKTYTNRQAALAQVPITDTSVRRVIDRFSAAVKGIAGTPIEVVVLRTDADFARIANDHGALPNTSFDTLARVDKNPDGSARPTIYMNTRRIEDAEASQLNRNLLSKATEHFVLPHITRTDPELKALLVGIIRVALKTSYGRKAARRVSDGYYANGVSPSMLDRNRSLVAELLRSAPKNEDGTYAITQGIGYRSAAAINKLIVNRWPAFARAANFSSNPADVSKINALFTNASRVDDLGYLPIDVASDWRSIAEKGELDRQRREVINQYRYTGALGRTMQLLRDRFALTAAIDASISKVSRNVATLPTGMTSDQVMAELDDAMNAVELRVRRTENRVRAEAEPLIDTFMADLRSAARDAGEPVAEFTKRFDTYVQLLSIQEMLSPGGDFYLGYVKLSKEARGQFEERFTKLIEDQKTVHNVEDRAALGRAARADIDRIVAVDRAGKDPVKISYAGYTLDKVNAELGSYARVTPTLQAAFDKLYPSFRSIMDRGTEIKYESGEYDPLDIAFRNRQHFVYRGGQVIDASKINEATDPDGRAIAGRKSTGSADKTFAARVRDELPKNATITALNELVLAIDKAERAKTVQKLTIATEIDPTLLARGKKELIHTRSEPQLKNSVNFDFDYIDAPDEGTTKSVQYITPDGRRTKMTFAHEDVLDALRQHSVDGPILRVMAATQGLLGSLYTTRNPAFVFAVQAPRDFIHNTFQIIAPRHGADAAFSYPGYVAMNLWPVIQYAWRPADARAAYLEGLPKSHPLRVYAEQGGWYGAHIQHAALDLAAEVKERGAVKTVIDAIPGVRHVGHLLDTFPEAADNLFRVAYVAVATDPKTRNALDAQTAVTRAGQLMDFSSGSKMQRMAAPYVPFARAWVNGGYNLMFRDLWLGGHIPLRETDTVDGKRVSIDTAQALKQFRPQGVALMMLTSGALYAMARAYAGPDDEPPSADDLTGGVLIPGTNVKWPYQYGWNKVFGSLGALAAAVDDGTLTMDQAQRAWANVWLKEATPFGLQYIPSSDQVSWARTMASQALSANAFSKFTVVPAIGVDSFGRQIFGRQSGVPKPSTPDAYTALAGEQGADLTAYTANQFGVISNIIDGIARYNSDNITDEQKGRAVSRALGLSSWSVGNRGVQEKINGQEVELVNSYAAELAALKRTPDKKDERALRRATPEGPSIEAYLKLDRRLGKEYGDTRKKYLGKPDFSARMQKLNEKHQTLRQKALAKIRERQRSAP